MNDEYDTPEINEGAKIIDLGQSLLRLKNSMEHAQLRAEESIKNAEALDRTEIVAEVQSLLCEVKTIRERLENPQIQEWTATNPEIPF